MIRLKDARTKNKITQKEVAEHLNVDRTTYVKYENGSSEPTLETVKKLADLFHVTTDFLLGRDEKTLDEEFSQKTYGGRITEAMNIHGFEYDDISYLTGFSRLTLDRVVQGDVMPEKDERRIIAAALGMTFESMEGRGNCLVANDSVPLYQIILSYIEAPLWIKKSVLKLLNFKPEEFMRPVPKDKYDIAEDRARKKAGLPPYDEMED